MRSRKLDKKQKVVIYFILPIITWCIVAIYFLSKPPVSESSEGMHPQVLQFFQILEEVRIVILILVLFCAIIYGWYLYSRKQN